VEREAEFIEVFLPSGPRLYCQPFHT
jgi:hypothetical protein